MVAELLFIYTQTLARLVLFYYWYQMFENVNINDKFLKISDKYLYVIYLMRCFLLTIAHL